MRKFTGPEVIVLPELTFTVTAVTEKSRGSSEKGDWILWGVSGLSEAGKTWNFITFDDEWEKHTGEMVTAAYQYTQRGLYKNLTLGKFPMSEAGSEPGRVTEPQGARPLPVPTPKVAASPGVGSVVTADKFGMLVAKMDEMLTLLRDIKKHFAE